MPVYVASPQEGVIVFDGQEDEPPPLIMDGEADEEQEEDEEQELEEDGEDEEAVDAAAGPLILDGHLHLAAAATGGAGIGIVQNAAPFLQFIQEQVGAAAAVHASHHHNHHPAFFDNVHQINFEGIGNLNHWLLGHHHHHPHANLQPNDIGVEQDTAGNVDVIDDSAIFPPLPLYGVLPDDIISLFHATGNQMHSASLRALKRRFQQIRERRPSYWQRVAFGMYKRTLRGATGGCDVRFLVKKPINNSTLSGAPFIWGHKFILASNPIFRQLFGYQKLEDSLADDHSDGHVTDIDIPTITAEGMRFIIMTAYDLKIAKLGLDDAIYLEYWAPRFCMDSLLAQCLEVISTSPMR